MIYIGSTGNNFHKNLKGVFMYKWLICFVLLICSASAYAGCNKQSFTGTWKVFMTTVDTSSFSWKRCTLIVSNKGEIKPDSACTTNDGEVISITGTTLNASKTCGVTGEIVLGEDTLTIVEGQLDRNKFSMSGVGLFTSEGDGDGNGNGNGGGEGDSNEGLFTFNGIKQ